MTMKTSMIMMVLGMLMVGSSNADSMKSEDMDSSMKEQQMETMKDGMKADMESDKGMMEGDAMKKEAMASDKDMMEKPMAGPKM